jgi:hypothetical protein
VASGNIPPPVADVKQVGPTGLLSRDSAKPD